MTNEEKARTFTAGDKVIFTPDGKVYDFGYIGGTGKAIIYEEGECNGQDAYAVDFDKIERYSIMVELIDTATRRLLLLM